MLKKDIKMNSSTSRRRLLIIINALSMGGAEQMVYQLVRSLNKEYQPQILCYGSFQGNALEAKIEKVCPVKYLGIKSRIGIKEYRLVFSAIKELNPDIVHAHQGGVTFALPWCALNKKPLCVTVHSKPEKAFSKANTALIRMMKGALKLKMVAVSKENLPLVKSYYKLKDNLCTFVNNGIDTKHFYKTPHDNFTFINVARQDQNKNQAGILKAFSDIHKAHNSARLILVGDGPCHESLKESASELGVSDAVKFTGLVSDAAEYYAASDVYLQYSFREGLPLSVLEAMASGLPIISTNVGGLKDVVNKNGVLITAGNDDELISVMRKMITASSDELAAMSEISKELVLEYSAESMAEKYKDIYNGLLGVDYEF